MMTCKITVTTTGGNEYTTSQEAQSEAAAWETVKQFLGRNGDNGWWDMAQGASVVHVRISAIESVGIAEDHSAETIASMGKGLNEAMLKSRGR